MSAIGGLVLKLVLQWALSWLQSWLSARFETKARDASVTRVVVADPAAVTRAPTRPKAVLLPHGDDWLKKLMNGRKTR